MRTPLLFLATALVLSQSASAKADDCPPVVPLFPAVLPLYPAAVPGEGGSIPAESIKGDRGHRQISNVSAPTLEIYLPAKEKNTGTAIVIAPGGGYSILAIDHEGYDVAKWLNSIGVAGIVLKYRIPKLPGTSKPAVDGCPARDERGALQSRRMAYRSEADRHHGLFGRRPPRDRCQHEL